MFKHIKNIVFLVIFFLSLTHSAELLKEVQYANESKGDGIVSEIYFIMNDSTSYEEISKYYFIVPIHTIDTIRLNGSDLLPIGGKITWGCNILKDSITETDKVLTYIQSDNKPCKMYNTDNDSLVSEANTIDKFAPVIMSANLKGDTLNVKFSEAMGMLINPYLFRIASSETYRPQVKLLNRVTDEEADFLIEDLLGNTIVEGDSIYFYNGANIMDQFGNGQRRNLNRHVPIFVQKVSISIKKSNNLITHKISTKEVRAYNVQGRLVNSKSNKLKKTIKSKGLYIIESPHQIEKKLMLE